MSKLMVNFTGFPHLYNIYHISSEGLTTMIDSCPIEEIPQTLSRYSQEKDLEEVILAGPKCFTNKIGKEVHEEVTTKYGKNDLTISYMEV